MSTFTTGGHELPHDFDLFFDIKTLEELKAQVASALSELTMFARLVERHKIEGVEIPDLFFHLAKQHDDFRNEMTQPLTPEQQAAYDEQIDIACGDLIASIYFGGRLDGADDLLSSLSPATQELIKSYAANPTIEGWDDVHGYIINRDRFLTLWQAVIAVDSTFPRVGRTTDIDNNIIKEWTRIPDAELIKQALAYAAH